MTPQYLESIKTRQPAGEIAQGIAEFNLGRDCSCQLMEKCATCKLLEDIKQALDQERAIIESLLGEVGRLQSEIKFLREETYGK